MTNERDGTITVIDTATDKVVSTLKVGGRPRGIRISNNKDRIWVAITSPSNESQGEDKIVELDPKGKVVAQYDAGTDPENFVLDDAATRLYIANEDAGTASITDVKANRVIATMPVGPNKVIGTVKAGNGPWGIAL